MGRKGEKRKMKKMEKNSHTDRQKDGLHNHKERNKDLHIWKDRLTDERKD